MSDRSDDQGGSDRPADRSEPAVGRDSRIGRDSRDADPGTDPSEAALNAAGQAAHSPRVQPQEPPVGRGVPRFGPPGPEGRNAVEVIWQNVWVRAAAYILGALLVLLLVWNTRGAYTFAVTVAIVGFLIAYILNPLTVLLQRLRLSRGMAVLLVYLFLGIFSVVGSVILGQIVAQLGEFLRLIPQAVENLSPYVDRTIAWFEGLPQLLERFGADPDPERIEEGVALVAPILQTGQQMITDFLAGIVITLRDGLERLLSDGSDFIFSGVRSIVSGGVQLFFILLISAYFLYDFPKFGRAAVRYVPVRSREVFLDVRTKTDRVVGGFLRGQVLICVLIGITLWIGLSIIGVPLALSISFFAAIFNIVPYLGPIISTVPAVILGFTVSPLHALGALLVFIIANQLEAHVYAPLVLGKTTNLHPVTVIVSILIGVGLWGVLGAFIAIPIVALSKVLLEDYLLTRPAFASNEGLPEEPRRRGFRLPWPRRRA